MRFSAILFFGVCVLCSALIITMGSGCAQISAPTGGPKDTIPPRLVNASPALNTIHFNGNKISLTFNEYIAVEEIQNNLLVSPLPKINPQVSFKLKTVTVKLKDSLLPNTTYSINFGNAIRDNNEGNPIKEFTYVFSTGSSIDSLEQSGKVILAETGKNDSTLIALLYRNDDDSAVQKKKPDYVAKLNGSGNFNFKNLSAGTYRIYALKDGDGSKTYNSKAEEFAFADKAITISSANEPITLYAYAEEKDAGKIKVPMPSLKTNAADRKLKFTTLATSQNQDIISDLELTFNRPLKKFDSSKIILTDTAYRPVPSVMMRLDSTRKKLSFSVKWTQDSRYRLIVGSNAATDTSGNTIAKTDTIRFITKKESEYGNIVLRFSKLNHSRHPVLQFVSGDEVKESRPLTENEWKEKLFRPGAYDLRILYDDNNNGKWDPGSYTQKRQPEKVVTLPQKISVRANWDNEWDIKL